MKKLFTLVLVVGGLVSHAQTFDTSFNHTGYSSTATWPQGNRIIQMPDGTTYEAVSNVDGPTVVKYTPEGQPDSTFGPYGRSVMVVGGCVTFAPYNMVFSDLAIQPDGMIIGVGYGNYTYLLCGYTNMVLFRMKPNGTADSTFGLCGMLQSYQVLASYAGTLNWSHLTNIKLLPSGKFLVFGLGQDGGATEYNLVMRFNSDGTLDTTFATGGIYTFAGIINDVFGYWDMSVDTSGNIVIAGDSYRPDSSGYYPYIQAIRITSAGILDYTFGDSGVVNLTYTTAGNGLTAIQQRPDGKYVITGYAGSYGTLTVLNTDGSIDSTSIPGGYATITLPGYGSNNITSFYVQPDDNKIVLAGYGLNGYNGCAYIGRLNVDGSYDSSFNGIGIDTFNYGVYTHWQSGTFLNDIKLVCGNRALATGGINNTTSNANQNMFIIRLKMDDTSNCTYVMPMPTTISSVSGQKNTPLVYPNPAYDEITIENALPNSTYKILNALGQTVSSGTIAYTPQSINILNLATGSYVLQLTDAARTRTTWKISKL